MFGFGHYSGSPEGAGDAESLRIDRRTDRLGRNMRSPPPHPGRGLSSHEHDTLELVNDGGERRRIGGDETLLITLPQRHNGWWSLCRGSLKDRNTMASTEENSEQTSQPTHASLSVQDEYSYLTRNTCICNILVNRTWSAKQTHDSTERHHRSDRVRVPARSRPQT